MFVSRIRIFAALMALGATPAHAQTVDAAATSVAEVSRTDGAINFAKTLTSDATRILSDEEKTENVRLDEFKSILGDGLALDAIGNFMLGASRETITDEQRERYDEIFPNYITTLYAEQFDEIVDKPLEVVDAREISSKDVIVRTQLERKDDDPILVDWRVRKLSSGEHKAIDIIVSGVSIMIVKREEFASYIETNGIDALLSRLTDEADM